MDIHNFCTVLSAIFSYSIFFFLISSLLYIACGFVGVWVCACVCRCVFDVSEYHGYRLEWPSFCMFVLSIPETTMT